MSFNMVFERIQRKALLQTAKTKSPWKRAKMMMMMDDDELGPVVQSIVSLTRLLMTNSLIIVAKVFSNTLIFLLQKCE